MWLKPPEGRDHPQTPGGQILMSCQCWTHQRGEGLMRRIMSPPEDIYRFLVPITLLLVSQVHQKWEASSVQWYRKVSSHVWMNEGNMVKSRTFREGKRAIRHKDCCLLRRYLGCRGNTVQYCVAVLYGLGYFLHLLQFSLPDNGPLPICPQWELSPHQSVYIGSDSASHSENIPLCYQQELGEFGFACFPYPHSEEVVPENVCDWFSLQVSAPPLGSQAVVCGVWAAPFLLVPTRKQ